MAKEVISKSLFLSRCWSFSFISNWLQQQKQKMANGTADGEAAFQVNAAEDVSGDFKGHANVDARKALRSRLGGEEQSAKVSRQHATLYSSYYAPGSCRTS